MPMHTCSLVPSLLVKGRILVVDDDQPKDLVEIERNQLRSTSQPSTPRPTAATTSNTTEVNGDVMTEALRLWNEGPAAKMVLRSAAQVRQLFGGLELVEPGVVSCSQWRPEGAMPAVVPHFGGVGRKP